MKIIIALLSLSLGLSTAYACDSYEECMQPSKEACEHHIGYSKNLDGTVRHNTVLIPCEKEDYLKAIAYKLDEISKKLDKQPRSNFLDEDYGCGKGNICV